jgi:DNA processing protein
MYTLAMIEYTYRSIQPNEFHPLMNEMNDPPKALWIAGKLPSPGVKMLCVVGARGYSAYGHEVCTSLINGLTGYPVCIVSGLAMGIDTIAHEAALAAGLQTIAFPGSGLSYEVLYPQRNRHLALHILEAGGALVSELPPDTRPAPFTFPRRNRLMAGSSHMTLIIEGNDRSGTNITARLALDYNRTVCAVPGSIFSPLSHAPHELIKGGAYPVTRPKDVLDLLGIPSDTVSPYLDDFMDDDPP